MNKVDHLRDMIHDLKLITDYAIVGYETVRDRGICPTWHTAWHSSNVVSSEIDHIESVVNEMISNYETQIQELEELEE